MLLAPPSKTTAIAEAIQARFPEAGILLQPQVQGRAFRVECILFPGEGEAAAAEEEALFRLARELMPLGAYYDRPYGRLPELVYTEPVSLDAVRRLKKIFDPDGILNPGKLCF